MQVRRLADVPTSTAIDTSGGAAGEGMADPAELSLEDLIMRGLN